MKKVLILEDDKSLGSMLKERLEKIYSVDWASDIKTAKHLLNQTLNSGSDYDLAILDLGLPDGNGFEFAQLFKEESKSVFIFLTAQADAEHRLTGFELGAAEFIPKPFHLKELLLRTEHVLKEHKKQTHVVQLQSCEILFEEQKILFTDGRIEFPPINELKLLKLLIDASPQVLSRDQISDAIWGVDKVPSPRSIDNMIVKLRQILGKEEKHIRSVRGVGYQWVSDLNFAEEEK